VIVPIPRGDWKSTVLPKAEALRAELTAAGVRVKLDATEENSPGWKFAEWELRGVPLRLEIGPKDIEKGQVFSARRDTREKAAIAMAEAARRVPALLEDIQQNLLSRARQFRDERTLEAATWDEFKAAMAGRPGFVIASWCGSAECEAEIKAETQATLRNIPVGSARVRGQCVKCNGSADVKAWFAKAY
jgi:prolyl-tRNA synthetase